MRRTRIQPNYDEHIIKALKDLPKPLITFDGHIVLFDIDKPKETIYQHVANKKHHILLSDITLVPSILKNPNSIKPDRSGSKFRTYIGKRKKTNEKTKYVKIVTRIGKKHESIHTIYLIKHEND